MNYYEVTHSSPEIATVKDYCSRITSPAASFINKISEFLSLKDDKGITNRERVFHLYNPTERASNQNKSDTELQLKVGTRFVIPVNTIHTAGLLTQGIEVVSNDIPGFKARKLVELESDINYRRSSHIVARQGLIGTVEQSAPNLTIWIWCKALSNTTDIRENEGILDSMEGQIFDLSPFVISAKTSVGDNGGNWNITLPPLVCKLETIQQNGKTQTQWVLRKQSVDSYELEDNVSGYRQQYLGHNDFFKGEDAQGEPLQSDFLFHNIIGENDVVFIRFETLELEKEQRYRDATQFYVNKQNLAGRVYDMIGLVDANTKTINSQANDVSIRISGRDLSKLFIDDTVYFANLENITGQFRIAGKATQKNELMGRLVGDNSLYFLSLYQNNSIEEVLKFVIQQLSTISIVPDSLFFSYGDRRNTSQTENGGKLKARQFSRELELRKEYLRTKYKDFDNLYSFLKDIRTKKVRRVQNDITVGWESFVTEDRQRVLRNEFPDFLQTSYNEREFNILIHLDLSAEIIEIDTLIDSEETRPKGIDDNRFTETYARGIWQIVKLAIDKNVTKRRIVDSSMSSANGSLLNFIRKVCLPPFVEFYTDTYGDTFNIIVRKPLYDRRSLIDNLSAGVDTEDTKNTGKQQTSIIDIEQYNVLTEDLSYDTTAYSWYSLKPQNVFTGGGSTLPTAYVPALFFEEYANIWGSRPLESAHNYNPYYPFVNKEGITDISRFELQAFTDLKYLIESHAHLPFTRKGRLSLSCTDRRIKKGNLIRYKTTGEIFLVDSVAHSMSMENSIEANTVINVSRGMIESLICGINIGDLKNVSYFNIINTDIDIKIKKYKDTKTTQKIVKEKKQKVEKPKTVDKPLIDTLKVKGSKITDEQKNNSLLIYNTGKSLGASDRDIQVAYMVAIQESEFRNLKGQGRKTFGLFQQDPIKGWGTVEEIVDMVSSITSFFKGTVTNKGVFSYKNRGDMSLGAIAQKVQSSTNSAIYSRWSKEAEDLVDYYRLIGDPTIEMTDEYIIIKEETFEDVTIPGYVGVDRESVFSNMKVNKDIFNFFLRRQQFGLQELQYEQIR